MTNITYPNTIKCPYCSNNMERIKNPNNSMSYCCDNHKPLFIHYFWNTIYNDELLLDNINIHTNYFRLNYDSVVPDKCFSLQEFNKSINHNPMIKNSISGFWAEPKSGRKTFDYDWVLSQTPDRIISLLEMYKIML